MDPNGNHMLCGVMWSPGISSPTNALVLYMDRIGIPYWEYFFMESLTGSST
jgi:hypothetical protein